MDFFAYKLINQLKKRDLISRYDFYFDFDSNDTGKIIIGSLPNETNPELYNNTDYSFFSVSKVDFSLDWAFIFDEIDYGEEKLYFDLKKVNILRIEFGFIKGSFDMEEYVKKDFFEPLINSSKCFRKSTSEIGTSIYYYYCDKDIDLNNFKPWKFTINEFEMNFTFTKDDLFLDIGDKYIFLMGFSYGSKLILGYPFLKKYKIIFNQDLKTIGFIHKNPLNKKYNNFSWFYKFLCFILFVIIVLLSYYLYKFYIEKPRRIKANELNEKYDYEPNIDSINEEYTKIDDNNNIKSKLIA